MEAVFLKSKYLNSDRLVEGLDHSSYDLAFSSEGLIYIAEYRHDRIAVFDKELNKIKHIEGIETPHGLCFDRDGFIYVATFRNGRIFKFNPSDQRVSDWDRSLTENKIIDKPVALACDADNNLYIADYGLKTIIKVNKEGQHLLTFDSSQVMDEENFLPHGMVVDAKNNLYVANRGKQKTIHVFDLDGKLKETWKRINADFDPLTVQIFGDKFFAVPNYTDAKIFLFDETGKALKSFGHLGNQDGEFLYIMNLVIDEKMHAYIVEQNGNRLQKIDMKEVYNLINSLQHRCA